MTVPSTQVTTLLTQFNLTTASEELVPRLTQAGHHDALPVLLEVFEAEAEARRQRRIARLRRASRLPPGKTFETLDTGRLPGPLVQQLKTLASGAFLETATNVLAFGLPGVGKSHGLCAVGHALVEAGRSVLCVPAYALVQELLGAKRDLDLPRALRKLDLFEVILLDDLGYVQQSPDEAEVLFTLLAERYERRSMMVTSNLVFSQWDRIFRDQMATAAAIDRLVHHAVVLEFDVPSFRTDPSRPTSPPSPPPVPRAGRRGRCCRGVADLQAPERLRSGSDHGFDRDVHGAHRLAGSRSNHQPLPSEAARSATALRERPQADVHAVWSSASSEPAATPTERCVVERAAVRTGKNS